MRTQAEDAALSAFIDAATSDADPGYPHGAAFIPWQETRQTDRILWRYLHEVLQRIAVEVSYRRKEAPPAPDIPPVRADIGRHALERLTPAGKPVARFVSTTTSRHLAAMVAEGAVRPGNGTRHVPKPVEATGTGKTAAEYVSEGRR